MINFKNKDKKSFSLIELILVMLIAGIAIPAVIMTFAELAKKSVQDEAMQASTMLAEGELERVLQKSFDAVLDEYRDSPVSCGGNFSGYTWQVRVDAVPSGIANDPTMLQYKQVEVRVTNSTAGDVSLWTIVTNN